MPAWYVLMIAARWIGVAPWIMEKAPVYWRQRALLCYSLEKEVANERRNNVLEALAAMLFGRR